MKHLYIKQNNNVEIVSSDIIEKLYQISQGEGLDSTSDLIGNLQCTHAYDDTVTYLTTKFKNLQINVTDGSYINFEDSKVAEIIINNFGDGTGITKLQCSQINSLNNIFRGNTNIIKFNELKYFAKIVSSASNRGASFIGCTNLQEIDLSNMQGLTDGAFVGCTNLKYIGEVYATYFWGSGYFRNCTNLIGTSKDKPYIDLSNVTAFNGNSYSHFSNCSSLKKVLLPKLNILFGHSLFEYCTSLIDVENTDVYSSIERRTYIGCTSLVSLNYSSLVTTIGYNAFSNCTALTHVGDLSNVTSIGTGAFAGCKLLADTINLSNLTSTSDECFYNCNNLNFTGTLLQVTFIGANSFNSCTKLALDLDLPNIIICSQGIFSRCSSLSSVHLYNVTKIDKWSFDYCTSLRYIRIDATAVPTFVDINAFGQDTCNFYVTDSLVDTYKTATNWSTYASRIFSLTQFATDFPNG